MHAVKILQFYDEGMKDSYITTFNLQFPLQFLGIANIYTRLLWLRDYAFRRHIKRMRHWRHYQTHPGVTPEFIVSSFAFYSAVGKTSKSSNKVGVPDLPL